MPHNGLADKVEKSYDKIEKINKKKGTCVILMYDQNAVAIGRYDLEKRNERRIFGKFL